MADTAASPRTFRSFAEFYPYYLGEHRDPTCRRLHFVGTTLSLVCLAMLLATGRWGWLLGALLCGYGFAWIGHFFFEKNRPATFRHPLYSLLGDHVMYKDLWTGRIPFRAPEHAPDPAPAPGTMDASRASAPATPADR